MPRLDALATLYLFHTWRRLAPAGRGVPILMYHSVCSNEDQVHPYYRTVTRPSVFADHMQYLHDEGYVAMGLGEASRFLAEPGAANGKRPVAITFDDGFEDFYTNAFPVLDRFGFTASMYLPTAYIGGAGRGAGGAGESGDVAEKFPDKAFMNWSQVRELHRRGIEFGSHTVTHPQLKSEKLETVRREVRDSKDRIEQELGAPVTSFAYPYAFPETDRVFREKLRGMLEEAGYENGVCTIVGTAEPGQDRYFMPRLPANSCDHPRLFQAKLEGAYDWVHTLQYASKLLKS